MLTISQRRNIQKHFSKYADTYPVLEPEINEFKEPTGNYITIGEISGIYETKSSNVSTKTDNNGVTKSKKRHLLHTLEKVDEGVVIRIGNSSYKVIDIEDAAKLGFSYMITLEEC